jgi:hypothetical protein
MRRTVFAVLAVAMTFTLGLAVGPGGRGGAGAAIGCSGMLEPLAGLPAQDVSGAEQADLVYMREEEKLARDVYQALDGLWGLRAFGNIGWAEQNHMDAILALLDKYGIADPVGENPPGAFSDAELQALFGELLDQGMGSLLDALLVGATIEDRDIFDLTAALDRTDNDDVRMVYENLRKASRNHLRSFVGLLAANGVDYEPQYLGVEEYEAIVTSSPEHGLVGADGLPVGCESRRRLGAARGGPNRERVRNAFQVTGER